MPIPNGNGASNSSTRIEYETRHICGIEPRRVECGPPFMIKSTQLFGWLNEPVDERPSEFFGRAGGKVPPEKALARTGTSFQRSATSIHDSMLSPLVPRWMESLPPDVKPRFLCKSFPRIANRLALCWADSALTVRLLDDFLTDKRGSRLGFPAKATRELSGLRQAAFARLGDTKP